MIEPPATIDELLKRCSKIEGLSFGQLSQRLGQTIPDKQNHRKGWAGGLIELALGTDASTKAAPDFTDLAIELKTVPLNHQLKPCESTYVTTVPLLKLSSATWQTSVVCQKLTTVLWVPVEGDKSIAYHQRRIGKAQLHSPDESLLGKIKQDWLELTELILLGKLETINASIGQYLHIRPKAANGKVLCDAYGVEGQKIKTLPRGYYLRPQYTAKILVNDGPSITIGVTMRRPK